MPARFVEVAAYSNSIEAGFAQGLLEEAWIPAQLDGLTSQSWGAGEVPATGFRILVPAAHAERALDVLRTRPPRVASEDPDQDGEEDDDAWADAAEASEAGPGTPIVAQSAAEEAQEDAHLERRGRHWNVAVAPGAAWLLGLFVWGVFAQAVAFAWAFALLVGRRGADAPSVHRGQLWVVLVLSAAGTLVCALGWPVLNPYFAPGSPLDAWIWIDLALAVGILLAWRASRARAA